MFKTSDPRILYVTQTTNFFLLLLAAVLIPCPGSLTPAKTSALFSKALSPSDDFPSHNARFQTVSSPSSHCPSDLRRNLSFKCLLAERDFQSIPITQTTGEVLLFFFNSYPMPGAMVTPFLFSASLIFSVNFSVILPQYFWGKYCQVVKR